MPFTEYLWMVICLLLYIKQTLGFHVAKNSDSSILTNLLMDPSFQSRQKRPAFSDDRLLVSGFNTPSECCPTVTRAIAPLGGLSKDGQLLQLFRDRHTIQKFYETTCAPDIRNHRCNFIDHSKWISKCQQTFTYTYAIVKNFNVTEPYRIDYMRMKSGCSCTIEGPKNEFAILDELTAEMWEEK
ncbi:uncharacterized protein LOC128225863 [Mya arenaria]|uniref:uncharacterized protein LOC128225863 n=1 Tax=Mya arenaria TaxID=6604 RepID=UPI0022E4B492|nr:uncharacterized protein LOC128225863 [Mya arenaria]